MQRNMPHKSSRHVDVRRRSVCERYRIEINLLDYNVAVRQRTVYVHVRPRTARYAV